MSTRNSWHFRSKSKLPPHNESVALRQLNPIHESGYNSFKDTCNQYWTNFIGHAGNSFCGKFSVKLKFYVSEHIMPCALEITNNARFKQVYGILLLNHYLHCRNSHGHQTWQYSDLTWWALNHKVTWPFDHMIFWDHATNKKHVSTTAVPMSTKFDMMTTYLEWPLVIKWRDPLIMWPFKIMW